MRDSPATRLDDHIAEQIGVKITPAILLVKDLREAKVVTDLIARSKVLHGDQKAFDKAASLNDLVPDDVVNRRREIGRLRPVLAQLPESVQKGEQMSVDEGRIRLRDCRCSLPSCMCVGECQLLRCNQTMQ